MMKLLRITAILLLVCVAPLVSAHDGHGMTPGLAHELVHAAWAAALMLVMPWWFRVWRSHKAMQRSKTARRRY